MSAPASPRIKKWDKRIMGWGCAPSMLGGLLVSAGLAEAGQAGFLVSLALGLPLVGYTFWLRRQNNQRFDEAQHRAAAEGLVVKRVETAEGDFDYRLLSQEEHDRERWGDDLERWRSEQAAGEADARGAMEEGDP